MQKNKLNRRHFVGLLTMGGLLQACVGQDNILPAPAAQVVSATPIPPTPEPATATPAKKLPIQGKAQEWDNSVWLNTEPLKLADLRGKVVIMEFWTFSCYNCRNVMPSLKSWHEEFNKQGLVIVGMHCPEFDYEKKLENVKDALVRNEIKYPVAIDNDFVTWNKFGVRAWPSLYLLDKEGNIRFSHIGEGAYDETKAAIKELLAE